MKKLGNRYFTKLAALLMTVMLVAAFMPADVSAAAKDIKVYMTVSNKGVIAKTKDGDAMAWKEVTVKDLDASGDFNYDEALKAAHSAYNSADGYAAASSGWVTSLWGVKDNPGSYYFTKNGGATDLVTTTKISDGDHLIAAVSIDTELYADWACSFDKNEVETTAGKEVTLTLKGFPSMTMNKAVPGNNVSVGTWDNGKMQAVTKTDKNGKVKISFPKPGTYILTAGGTAQDTVKSTDSGGGFWSPYMPADTDKDGETIWGKMDWSTYTTYIGYLAKDYGKGPYPFKEITWFDWNDYDKDTFNLGHLMYSGNVIYDCPLIAPCCIVTVDRADQNMAVKGKKIAVKAKKFKKKARKLSVKRLVSVKNAVGKVTYTIKPANKKAKKLLKCKSGKAVIKSGKVIIKKKAKKGTYKFKITVSAAGSDKYKAAKKTVKAKIVVK